MNSDLAQQQKVLQVRSAVERDDHALLVPLLVAVDGAAVLQDEHVVLRVDEVIVIFTLKTNAWGLALRKADAEFSLSLFTPFSLLTTTCLPLTRLHLLHRSRRFRLVC